MPLQRLSAKPNFELVDSGPLIEFDSGTTAQGWYEKDGDRYFEEIVDGNTKATTWYE